MEIFKVQPRRVTTLCFSPDGSQLAFGGKDSVVCCWDQQSGERIVDQLWLSPIETIVFSPSGEQIIARSVWGEVLICELTSDASPVTLISGITGARNSLIGIDISAEAGLLAVAHCDPGGYDNLIRFWNVQTWLEQEDYTLRKSTHVLGLAFDSRGERLAFTGGVLDLSDRSLLFRAELGTKLRWSPDEALIAATRYKSSFIALYDAETGRIIHSLTLPSKAVQDFAFSPDGAYLLAVSNEELVRVWRVGAWEELPGYAWNIGQLKSIAFSPDGQRVASGSDKGTIVVWDWDRE